MFPLFFNSVGLYNYINLTVPPIVGARLDQKDVTYFITMCGQSYARKDAQHSAQELAKKVCSALRN